MVVEIVWCVVSGWLSGSVMMNFFLSIMCVLMFVYVVGSWIILKLIWWLCSVVIWLGVGMFFSLSVISG